MKIHVDTTIPHTRQAVFEALRDRLPELAEHLPNVTEISTLERTEREDGAVVLRNLWKADAAIPTIAQKVISKDKLAWYDDAVWDESAWTCEWTNEPMFFTGRIDIQGRNTYTEVEPGTTNFTIDGHIDLDVNLPGVPSIVARKLRPVVEKFVVGLITPNLKATAGAVTKLLDAEKP